MNEHYPSFAMSVEAIRAWKHGEFPMPDWLPQHISGSIESNGTFAVETELGRARVHLGNIVIECCGQVWVREQDEAADFVKELEQRKHLAPANIGPGKVRQFGSSRRSRKRQEDSGRGQVHRRIRYCPVTGSPPSIEWIRLDMLSVDNSYQRSTDNEASRRLIASIAAKFD